METELPIKDPGGDDDPSVNSDVHEPAEDLPKADELPGEDDLTDPDIGGGRIKQNT